MDNAALEVEGSVGGIKGIARFRDSLSADISLHLILIIMMGVLIYLVVGQENDRERRYTSTNQALLQLLADSKRASEERAALLRIQTSIINEAKIQTYVLTRTEVQRQALQLTEPEELRQRRRGN